MSLLNLQMTFICVQLIRSLNIGLKIKWIVKIKMQLNRKELNSFSKAGWEYIILKANNKLAFLCYQQTVNRIIKERKLFWKFIIHQKQTWKMKH